MTQYLTFILRNAVYAVPVAYVQEVLEYTEPNQLPCAQDYIEGIISSRGHGIQVVNLCKRFGLEPSPVTSSTRIIVFELKTSSQETSDQEHQEQEKEQTRPMIFGAVADGVEEVMDIDLESLDSVPKFGNDIPSEYIAGVTEKSGRFVILLDLNRIFLEGDNS